MNKDSKNNRKWFIGVILFFAIILISFLFVRQYQDLGKTIENERITYISEIKNQLVKNIKAEKEQQIKLVDIYGQFLMNIKPQHFSDVEALFADSHEMADGDEIFFIDVNGRVFTLTQQERSLTAQNLIYELMNEKKDVFGYTQLNQGEEYWIYGTPIEPVMIDDINVCAVINARSIKNFGQRMSTSILDDKGFSYITSKEGNVLVFPSVENNMGYNLFNTFKELGADDQNLEMMKKDFQSGEDGTQMIEFDGNKWLVDYSAEMYDDWVVVVMMPMTITGADTYNMLNATMFLIVLLFSCILIFIMFMIRYFYLRERSRELLIQQEKASLLVAQKIAESKNDFLAKMSHDIRTPLNAIIGLIQITLNQVSDQPKISNNLKQASESAEYLLNILNDILDMAKIESGKMEVRPEPFSLSKLIDSLKNMNLMQANKKHIDFVVQENHEWDDYLGDKSRISQIMMNLLSNAMKFTKEGGHVLLSVNAKPAAEGVDCIQFIVKDDGVGMSEAYIKKLFQPFEQESETQNMNQCGSGLGLSIVKNLLDLMEGTITVESVKNAGSCFTVDLCLPRALLIKNTEDKQEENVNLQGKKVLLVEDNEINAMIAREILENNAGMEVDHVWNGQEAVNRFAQSNAEEYDVILMDVRMPVMDGLTATLKIRELKHPKAAVIPIIAMSANAFDEDITKALKYGMSDYLSKPIDIEKLLKALKKNLEDQDNG